ncbi:hypothetical protein [Paenibacillus lautus]|nr:hypothetical protein [Paenibacillus lautus]MEC0256190.1 hypothetical protein [Paenibacillus lautus]
MFLLILDVLSVSVNVLIILFGLLVGAINIEIGISIDRPTNP